MQGWFMDATVAKDSDRLTYHSNGNCVNYVLKGFLITGNSTTPLQRLFKGTEMWLVINFHTLLDNTLQSIELSIYSV